MKGPKWKALVGRPWNGCYCLQDARQSSRMLLLNVRHNNAQKNKQLQVLELCLRAQKLQTTTLYSWKNGPPTITHCKTKNHATRHVLKSTHGRKLESRHSGSYPHCTTRHISNGYWLDVFNNPFREAEPTADACSALSCLFQEYHSMNRTSFALRSGAGISGWFLERLNFEFCSTVTFSTKKLEPTLHEITVRGGSSYIGRIIYFVTVQNFASEWQTKISVSMKLYRVGCRW